MRFLNHVNATFLVAPLLIFAGCDAESGFTYDHYVKNVGKQIIFEENMIHVRDRCAFSSKKEYKKVRTLIAKASVLNATYTGDWKNDKNNYTKSSAGTVYTVVDEVVINHNQKFNSTDPIHRIVLKDKNGTLYCGNNSLSKSWKEL